MELPMWFDSINRLWADTTYVTSCHGLKSNCVGDSSSRIHIHCREMSHIGAAPFSLYSKMAAQSRPTVIQQPGQEPQPTHSHKQHKQEANFGPCQPLRLESYYCSKIWLTLEPQEDNECLWDERDKDLRDKFPAKQLFWETALHPFLERSSSQEDVIFTLLSGIYQTKINGWIIQEFILIIKFYLIWIYSYGLRDDPHGLSPSCIRPPFATSLLNVFIF